MEYVFTIFPFLLLKQHYISAPGLHFRPGVYVFFEN